MKKLFWILAVMSAAALVRAEEPAGGEKKPEHRGPPRGGEMFEGMDANKDGKITAEEMAAKQAERQEKAFSYLDKNGDGAISKEEVPQRSKDGEGPGRGRIMPEIGELDKDNNGSVSKDEFFAGAKERSKEFFYKLDANGDGAVTKDEAAAMREKFGQGRGDRKPEGKGDQK